MAINTKSSNVDTHNFIPSLLIIAFLLVGFIPNLGAVDKIAPQWVYLCIINIISSFYLFLNRKRFEQIIYSVSKTAISIFFICFLTWASLSFFYAINPIEALVNIARHINTLLMYLYIGIFIYGIKEKHVLASWIMMIILSIEVYSVFTQAMDMININGSIFADDLKGVTANRNITAFSIALKIPFVLFLIETTKNKYLLSVFSILIFFSLLDLSMISSRASFIAVGIIFIGTVFSSIFKYSKGNKSNKSFLKIFFYLIPLVLAIILNQTYFSKKGVDVLDRASTIALNTSDDSISKRLRYYEDVLTHMIDNPIFGTGIGNWKFESIRYDRAEIDGYIVPYHAHSDFIQLGAELGFVGFFLYLFIFLSAIYFTFIILFNSKIQFQEKIFLIFLITSLGVYLIDANLNFPIARPQELAPWALVMALINFYFIKSKLEISDNEVRFKKNRLIFSKLTLTLGMFFILLPVFSMNYKVYKSQILQMTILRDFNAGQYSIPLNQIETLISTIPNVTVTTIPMDAIKARYYFQYKKYDKALEYAQKAKFANPYLPYGDIISSQIYFLKGDLDRAKKYAKIAFFKMPNNTLHIAQYMKSLINTRDLDALEKAYPFLIKSKNGWYSYLSTKLYLIPPGDQVTIKRAEKAFNLFPNDERFKNLFKKAKIGESRVSVAYKLGEKAQEKYSKQLYREAAKLYDEAIEIDPYEYSYYENASLSYYSYNQLDIATQRIDKVINEMNPLNGKCEYIKGLIYIKYGLNEDSCELLRTSLSSGFIASQNVLDQYCNK